MPNGWSNLWALMAGGFIRPEDVSAVQAFMAACIDDWEDMATGNNWEDDRKEGADPMHGKVVEWDLSNIGEEYKWSIDYRLERATFFKALLNVLVDPKRRARAVKRGPDIIRLLADPTLGMINLRSGNNSPRPISGQAEMDHAEAVILGEEDPDRRWLPPAQNVVEGFAGK